MKGYLKKRNKTYHAVINIKDANGNWCKKWISTKTGDEREAKKKLKEIMNNIDRYSIPSVNSNKNFNKAEKMKVHELMEFWLNNIIINTVEPTTHQGYVTNVNTHIIPYFKKRNIQLRI